MFPKVGENLGTILDTFQKEGWPDQISVSFGGRKLYDAVRPLNDRIGKEGPIWFTPQMREKLVRWDVTQPRRDTVDNH